MKAFFLLLAVSLLLGCARLETKVTRFHHLPPAGSGQTFTVSGPKRSAEGGGNRQLEFDQYAARIAERLTLYGWRQVRSHADFQVTFDCGIAGSRAEYSVVPVMGETGGGAVFYDGATYNKKGKYRGSTSGVAFAPPTYGVVGAVPVPTTVYDHYLTLSITNRAGKQVFQSRALSSGFGAEINEILPGMVNAVFTEFPGPSGITKNYRQRLPAR